MKQFRNCLCIWILTLCCLLLLPSEGRMEQSFRLWVGDTELTDGGTLSFGSGTAVYDPAEQVLTLTDIRLSGNTHGAGIYADGNLCIRLSGSCVVSGEQSGVTVLGDLTLCGSGSITCSGSRGGAAVRGCVTVYDSAELTLRGKTPLRWGKLHISPLDTIAREPSQLSVRGPYTVLLLDGSLDAAGHPLTGEYLPEQFSVRANQPVPQPEVPVRDGYRFGGWYADEALTVPFDFSIPRSSTAALYARWIQIVTLNFDSWGGSDIAPQQIDWGDLPSVPPEPVRDGYLFRGWYADDNLRVPFDWLLPMEQNKTAYAKWEKVADLTAYGIDAARYQGEVDWDAVKADGKSFVFLRLGFRGYGSEGKLNTDDNFEVNYEAAAAAGLDVGVYFFSQAVNEEEAEEEARYVLSVLDGRSLELPVVLDYELASNGGGGLLGRLYEADLSGEEYASVCLCFCRYIESSGYTAAVYAGQSMLNDGVGQALDAAGYPVWLAHWTVQPRYGGSYAYWQYSGSGKVRGIDTETDLDIRYLNIPNTVTGVTAQAQQHGNFLHWDRLPGVQGYIIYRSEPGSSEFTEIARRSGAGSISFSDYAGKSGSRYRVCAWVSYERQPLLGPLSAIAAVNE